MKFRRVSSALLLIAAMASMESSMATGAQMVRVAGGFRGDGGPASEAQLQDPARLEVGPDGSVYIVEQYFDDIRKVDPSGVITTFAGDGTGIYSGDGGLATAAGIVTPWGLAADQDGNVYTTDMSGARVRKIDTNGIITTFAGNGSDGFAGDGGPATDAQISHPDDIAIDQAGNVYIADRDNGRIRKVDPSGVITTFAGGGNTLLGQGWLITPLPALAVDLNGPNSLAVHPDGSLYVIDESALLRIYDFHGVQMIEGVAGAKRSYESSGDGGPASEASFHMPEDVAIDSQGNVFVAESDGRRIRRIDHRTGIITTYAGTGTYRLNDPVGDGGPAVNASISEPSGIAFDANDNLYVTDRYRSKVRKIDPQTGIITSVFGAGRCGTLYESRAATLSTLCNPGDAEATSDGGFFIADSSNQRIRRVDAAGTISTYVGNGTCIGPMDGPRLAVQTCNATFLATAADGDLLFADSRYTVRRVDVDTGLVSLVAGKSGQRGATRDGGPATEAGLESVTALASDSAGNVFIAENWRIRKIDPSGTITTIAGTGSNGFSGDGGPASDATFKSISGLAPDGQGNLYIADLGNRRVRRIDAAGIVTTVAGNGEWEKSGDGGPAVDAAIGYPEDIDVDELGNIYIGERYWGGGIRKVDAAGTISSLPKVPRPRGFIESVDYSAGALLITWEDEVLRLAV